MSFVEYQNKINQINTELAAGTMERTKAARVLDLIRQMFAGDPSLTLDQRIALVEAMPDLESQVATSIGLEEMRKKTAHNLLVDWLTKSVTPGGEAQATLLKVIKEKIALMESDFVTTGITRGKTKAECIDRWKQFTVLVELVFTLGDFGIMRADAINRMDLVAIHPKILEASKKDGAMAVNAEFNAHPLVGSLDVDQETLSSPSMGIVQKIVFAAFQEMKKNVAPINRRPTASEIDGSDPHYSVFSRNQTFTSNASNNLIEMVCSSDSITELASASPTHLGIKSELTLFPDEAKQIIRTIALWKCGRDDIGSLAAMLHLGQNKGAMKYSKDTGSKARPDGLLAAILYQIGKNSANDYHRGALNFIDLTQNEMMAHGRPDSPADFMADEKWTSPQNQAVVFAANYERRFNHWTQPTWERIPRTMYTPKYWYEDFPSLADFFNQGGAIDPIDGAKYEQARDAVLWMIEEASKSHLITIDARVNEAEQKAMVLVNGFNSRIGQAMSYIGPAEPTSRYFYVHELILAAYQYFLTNILLAVPGKIGFFGNSKWLSYDYRQLHAAVRLKIKETIHLNTTLKPYYWENLLTNHFLDDPNLMRTRRDDTLETNRFNSWLINHDPTLKSAGSGRRADAMSQFPVTRINVKGGWTSSYEEVGRQPT